MNDILWIWTILYSIVFTNSSSTFSHFDIEISFSNQTSKLSTRVFNLSAINYSLGSFPQSLFGENGQQIYEGDLLQIKGYVKVDNEIRKNGTCFIQKFHSPMRSHWIAVIIEEKAEHPQTHQHHSSCPSYALLTYTISSTNASVILFLHNQDSPFKLAASNYESHHQVLRQMLHSREVVFISLAQDIFPDLANQLVAANQQSKVSGMIQFFSQLRIEAIKKEDISLISEAGKKAISSGLLLILIILFLAFMLFCLARLSFCFCQRFCLAHSKSNRSRKLTAATKKALKQLPVKHLQQVDPLLSSGGLDQCAICIELFKPHDIIRSLPCRHLYHKACIDPWLLKHRSCPLCKQNILIACGIFLEDGLSATTSEDSENSSQQLSSTDSRTSDFTMSSRFISNGCAVCNQRRHRNHRYSSIFCFGRRRRMSHHHHDYRYHPRCSDDGGEASFELGEDQWYPHRGLTSLSETSPSGSSSPIRQRRSPPLTIYQAARHRFSSLSLSPSLHSASSKQNLQDQQLFCCLPWCSVWYAATPVVKPGFPPPQHTQPASCAIPQSHPSVYLQAMQHHSSPHSCTQYHTGIVGRRLMYQIPLHQIHSKGDFMKISPADACYPTGIDHIGFPYSSMAVKIASNACSILPIPCVLPRQSIGSALPSYEQVAAASNPVRSLELQSSIMSTKSPEETNRIPLCCDQTGSKTKVVYAVLSASTSRINDGSAYLPGHQFTSICSTSVAKSISRQLPVFVDVNDDFHGTVDVTQRHQNFFSSPELRSLPDTEDDGEGGLQMTERWREQSSTFMVKLDHPGSTKLLQPPAYSQTALNSSNDADEGQCVQSCQIASQAAPVHPIRKAAQFICQALSSTNVQRRMDNPIKQGTTTSQYDPIKSTCGRFREKVHHSTTFASSKLCTYFPLRCLRSPPRQYRAKQRYLPVREHIRRRKIGGGDYSYHQRLGKTLVLGPNGHIRREGTAGCDSFSSKSSISSSYFSRRCLSERREHARMRSVKVTVEPQETPYPYERPLQVEENMDFHKVADVLPSRPHSLPNTLVSPSFSVFIDTPHIVGSSAPTLLTLASPSAPDT